ncbi:3-oxoadipate enol-lactonase [Bosea vestrisii]|uniref:3-oxoadipate enol-lactonase n=1 Tax=Bosea vestrisii TaxID=151416 RepID=UPI0024DFAD38|nr:3-oxoadipate enol-lactonase [Bosea vestrisii]WID99510.1 3-oxoadipate enol-lactonase [Bosea vestrisii]
MVFARINGVCLHYRHEPAPGRPVLVFINSLGTDFRIWQDVADRLAGQLGFVFYDKRGHGLSELGDAPVSIETYAADLAALLDHLGITRATLCGLSIGGLIAQGLYKARPDLVDRLILCDTAAKIGTAQSWNDRIAATLSTGITGFADGVMEKWFTPDFHQRRSAELAGYKAMLSRQLPAGYAAACAALRDADYSAAAAAIDVPTLVVVGDQDGSTPPDLVRGLADAIPGARFAIIAGAGHIPCVEQPAALSALIADFMTSHRGV